VHPEIRSEPLLYVTAPSDDVQGEISGRWRRRIGIIRAAVIPAACGEHRAEHSCGCEPAATQKSEHPFA
jgi:hypothetical protein